MPLMQHFPVTRERNEADGLDPLVPLVDIQDPGPQKFWEVKSRALSRVSAFIACFSSCLELHPTNIPQSTDVCNYLWAKPH